MMKGIKKKYVFSVSSLHLHNSTLIIHKYIIQIQ